MKNWIKLLLFFITLLSIVYFLGPLPSSPVYNMSLPVLPGNADTLEAFIKENESKHPVKKDNEARIIWADSLKGRTKYAVVYLHGFSASQGEGDPVHKEFAKKFGLNLYLTRLAQHGLDTADVLGTLTVDQLWESAKEAYAIGQILGDSVILIGSSTGATLSLLLAKNFPGIKGIINLSANIRINNPTTFILNDPWGLQIARIVSKGPYFVSANESVDFKRYWYTKYRLEALVQLQELLESSMNKETFKDVTVPVLNLYYYKNEEEQDKIVRVDKILEMHKELGTPESLKIAKAIPEAGDHVLGSPIKNKDIASVTQAIDSFAINILKLKPKE